jgi:SEC-C motif-containing protein
MRSRYSAYQFKNADYLLKTWHHSTRPDVLDLNNDSTCWKKLKVISTSIDKVEFVAFFEAVDKTLQALYEKSYFIKEPGWFYLRGEELALLKLSKKMLCPCKSGRKFKHCCGAEL